jgi:ferrochelatase
LGHSSARRAGDGTASRAADERAGASGRSPSLAPYDAILLLSYGGPTGPDEVLPFLRDVTAGTRIPRQRLEQVGEHYRRFDGVSPINAANRALIAALEAELRSRGQRVPILFGNLHWYPRTLDTLRSALAFGARRILVLITSAYASYSGSRKYREHLAEVLARLGEAAADLRLDVVRPFFNDPGFIDANAAAIRAAAGRLGIEAGAPLHVAYVTHSIPLTMNDASGATGPSYLQQHEEVCRLLDERLGGEYALSSSLSFCSRSGSPHTPWLEPDVSQRLAQLAGDGGGRVVIAPIGFIADHMEVAYDLDTVALERARELQLHAERSALAATRPEFIRGLAGLLIERAARERGEVCEPAVAGKLAPFPDEAPADSCRRESGVVTGLPVIAGSAD